MADTEKNNQYKTNWFADHPVFTIITHTIVVAGAVFTFAKFYLIERVELDYKSQLDTKEAILEQYDTKLVFLEKENQKLTEERDRYFDYLKEIPNNVYFFENKISLLESEKLELASKLETVSENSNGIVEKYEYTSDIIKKNVTEIDPVTGMIICMNDIDYSGGSLITVTFPGQETKSIEVKAGYTEEFYFDNRQFQLIISSIDWTSNTYSFIIKEK